MSSSDELSESGSEYRPSGDESDYSDSDDYLSDSDDDFVDEEVTQQPISDLGWNFMADPFEDIQPGRSLHALTCLQESVLPLTSFKPQLTRSVHFLMVF